jgi:hypothetical protein
MLIFNKKSITILASATDIINALKSLPQKNTIFNSYSENAFSFGMWEKHQYGRLFGSIRFFGTIDDRGGRCTIKYSVWPGTVGIIGLLVFLSVFLYALALFLFSTVSLLFLALSITFPVIITINIISQERTCDERFIRKMYELETKEK